MLLLALEQSSPQGSVALLEAARLLGQLSWPDERRQQSRQLLNHLRLLLEQTAVAVAQIDVIAVGLGPGSYSGLRVALAVAQGLALPDGRRIYGLSSAWALAEDFLMAEPEASAMIIGDARRQHLWARVFKRLPGRRVGALKPWLLPRPEDPTALCTAAWLTPYWARIGALLRAQAAESVRLLEGARVPTAAMVGLSAWRRLQSGLPSETLAPIYLHSAVAKPPASAAAFCPGSQPRGSATK
ncbi:MAG: tRNA (adenosine(37)-N6)-threonylcarbamoyltransferase complex dimerization subunit type 1 TsaB [Lentisphaerae bacterium]|nr:tRNA (adenosine(37)-N6)-threonylcarbamoyltransferase complex dimerization subunit type 1 TsaB [Lentisphaerota bacterium]